MVTLAELQHSASRCTELPLVRRAHNSRAQDECSVDFDRYMIIYSNHIPCQDGNYGGRSSITALMLGYNAPQEPEELPCASETAIGCYLGDELVGMINFDGPTDRHPLGTVSSDGLVILWYPLRCFANVLNILHQEKHLSLSLVCADLEGEEMEPPMGALLSWPQPIGQKGESDR